MRKISVEEFRMRVGDKSIPDLIKILNVLNKGELWP